MPQRRLVDEDAFGRPELNPLSIRAQHCRQQALVKTVRHANLRHTGCRGHTIPGTFEQHPTGQGWQNMACFAQC